MDERVFYENSLILGLLQRRFMETALNNTGISSSDIGTVYEDALERVENWIDEAPHADVLPLEDISSGVEEAIRVMESTRSYRLIDYGSYLHLRDAIYAIKKRRKRG